jgi:hypothetical protein
MTMREEILRNLRLYMDAFVIGPDANAEDRALIEILLKTCSQGMSFSKTTRQSIEFALNRCAQVRFREIAKTHGLVLVVDND